MNQTKYLERVLKRLRMDDCYQKSIPYDLSIINDSTRNSEDLVDNKLYKKMICNPN